MVPGTVIDDTNDGQDGPAAEARVVDRESVQGMSERDPDALALVYDRHIRSVFGLAMRIMQDQNDAEEVVQGVFSQAWAQAARYDATRGPVAAWLLMMARTRAIDASRAKRGDPDPAPNAGELAVVDLPDPAVGAHTQVWTTEGVTQLRIALTTLSLPQRIAVELAYFEGLTHRQIAERLEHTVGTVKTQIRGGLLTLREALRS
jgi:RNA polymerase sigma-70 factor, ECF subfamily